MNKNKTNTILIILAILICSAINALVDGILIKFIVSILSAIIVINRVSKINESGKNRVDKTVNIISKAVKVLAVIMCAAVIIANVTSIKNVSEQYEEISNNDEISIIDYSGVITKKIAIESIKVCDGFHYIKYSIFNENDRKHELKDKYFSINNEIIDTVDSIRDVRIKDTIPLLLKSRKLFKNIKRLTKIYSLSYY